MIRGLILLLFVIVACTPNAQSWHGFPLPPDTNLFKEIDLPFDTMQILFLAMEGPGEFDKIVAFYQSRLTEGWERCPSSDVEWPAGREYLPARSVSWSNSGSRARFWVSTAEKWADDEVEELGVNRFVVIGHDADPRSWELWYRGFCAPHDVELFSPIAVGGSRGRCASASRGSRFDSHSWRTANELKRGEMTNDLICRGLLLGLDQEETIELLGPPDAQDNGAFSYRVQISTYPPLPPMADGILQCPETEAALRFDFTLKIPSEAHAPFGIDWGCWANGT